MNEINKKNWTVKKIGVVGPGIVGMPMAALLARARIKFGSEEPAKVVVIQRNSLNSGWKVDAINDGKSVIGGIEPTLDAIVSDAVKDEILSASHDINDLSDADVVLICVQTDKKGFEPDYGPLFGALEGLAKALQNKPKDNKPLVVFESTLAPSSMASLIKEHFAKYDLIEGEDILLGNSPNRVMPGRLVERVESSDKIIGGLHPETPQLIESLYSQIVTKGKLYICNSLTAEIVKTLENAYRDVRIAFSTEIVRYCDANQIDFYKVRQEVNKRLSQVDDATGDSNVVPSGGILIPTIGVGGHCLPKDGILLLWRLIEADVDNQYSLILKSREINDDSPGNSIELAEASFGDLSGKKVAVLGAAYRFNSEDTRNSPSLSLVQLLKEKDCDVRLHDPFVKHDDQNLVKFNLQDTFTNDLKEALDGVEYVFVGTAHKFYIDGLEDICRLAPGLLGLFDGCNIYQESHQAKIPCSYTGIGRATGEPGAEFLDFVYEAFLTMEKGLANEVNRTVQYFNNNYASTEFNKVAFDTVQELAASCSTGCLIPDYGDVKEISPYQGYTPELATCAFKAQASESTTPSSQT